ncbi:MULTISPECIES: hypothetical protein [unclassified Enterococcus]|uniref:hypothetical protein n=1 Tax=unclassified Enterococcus TaxID=2608891 RepID=UPI003F213183
MLKTKFYIIAATSNPGELGKKILDDVKSWLLLAAAGFATVQFILAMFAYMSKNPQKHAEGQEHAFRACLGLVGCFCAGTIIAYLQGQAASWGASPAIVEALLLKS